MAEEENYGDEEQQGGYGGDEQDQDQGGYGGDEQDQDQGGYGGDEPQQQDYAEPEPEPEPEEKEPEPEPEPEPQYDQQQDYGDVQAKGSVQACCEDIYSDNPSFNWFTTKLVDPVKIKTADLKVDRAGKGGLNELVDYMKTQDTEIVFFILRVNSYDDESSVRAKFVYGRYVGSKVKFMSKAKLTPNLGAIADQFAVKHLSKDADEEMKEFTPEKLSKEFLRIGGAHKPSKYEYGPNATYNVT